MIKRREFVKRLKALCDRRLTTFAKGAGEPGRQVLPAAPERDALLKKARLDDTAANIESWANSPALRRPK